MIPLDEARQYVLDRVARLGSAHVPLADAAGLVLAADVVAAEQVPRSRTAMDGFAVRAADVASVPVTLEVMARLPPVRHSTVPSVLVQAARIMTGAPMPDGADAVVMVEKTTLDEAAGTVLIDLSVSEGNHVRRAGEDVEPGDLLFAAGTVLTAGHLGVLAVWGCRSSSVFGDRRWA